MNELAAKRLRAWARYYRDGKLLDGKPAHTVNHATGDEAWAKQIAARREQRREWYQQRRNGRSARRV